MSGPSPHLFRAGETGSRAAVQVVHGRTTTLRMARPDLVWILELGPELFRPGSAVPRARPPAPPRLLDVLVAVLRLSGEQPGAPCLVAGHDPDAGLGGARAGALLALLRGDAEALGAACQARHAVEDWQELCKLAAARHPDWSCDPGDVDGKPGPRSKGALKALRRGAGLPAGGDDVVATDWAALLGLVDPDLARRLGLDAAGLAARRAGLPATTPCPVACADAWPAKRVRIKDHVPARDVRLDVMLFDPVNPPNLQCHAGGALTATKCDVFRKGKYRALKLEAAGQKATVLELASSYFDTESAQFLPRPETPPEADGAPAPSTEEQGLDVVVCTYRFLKLHPDRSLVVAGHTDTAGSDAYNQPLSEARARCVTALLEGQREAFVEACKAYHRPPDDAVVLRYMARTRGWPCDPGEGATSASPAHIKAFQVHWNLSFSPRIAEDGKVGKQTWGAYFDVYEDDLQALAGGAEGLAAERARLRWVDPAKKSLGCGEDYPRVLPAVDGLTEQGNRRVEVLFFEPTELPPEVSGPAIYGGDYTFEPLDLTAAAFRAIVQVVEVDQTPLAGASVGLHLEETGARISDVQVADAQGGARWDELPFDRYVVHVEQAGRAFMAPIPLRAQDPSSADGADDPVIVVAPPRWRALLRIVSAAREPLVGATAQLFREDGTEPTEEKTTDADGQVGWDVPLEEYVVRVEHEGRAFSAFVSLRGSDGEPLEVVAPPRWRAALRIVSCRREPLAGAKARLFREDGTTPTEETTTDADGQVGWDVPLEEYAVHVTHGGRMFSAFVSLRETDGEPLEVVAPPRWKAALRLVTASREPLAGAKARLFRDEGVSGEAATPEATSDASGLVGWDVPLEEYAVHVTHGGRMFSAFVSLRETDGEPLEVVAPPRWKAALRLVTASREPLAGAKARLFRDEGVSGEAATPEATSDASGLVGWDVPLEEYAVHVTHGGRMFSAFVSLRDGAAEPLEVVAPPRWRAALRLVTASREPLAGAKARLFRDEGVSGEAATPEATSDASGLVGWDVPLEEYAVRVTHEGRTFSAFVSLRETDGEPLEVVAPPRWRASLRLTSSGREPLAGARAQLFRDEGVTGEAATPVAVTGADGLVGWDVPLEEYVVHVEHDGRAFSQVVSLRDGADEPLEVLAPPRWRAHLRIVDLERAPLAGARARLFREDGQAATPEAAVGGDGVVSWDVPPEEYVVHVEHGGPPGGTTARAFSQFVTLRDGPDEPLEVIAPPLHRLAVRFLRLDQQPLAGAVARLERPGASPGEDRTTDAQGEVGWDDLPAGEYVVLLDVAGATFASPVILGATPSTPESAP